MDSEVMGLRKEYTTAYFARSTQFVVPCYILSSKKMITVGIYMKTYNLCVCVCVKKDS